MSEKVALNFSSISSIRTVAFFAIVLFFVMDIIRSLVIRFGLFKNNLVANL